jgi:hypothetical protein
MAMHVPSWGQHAMLGLLYLPSWHIGKHNRPISPFVQETQQGKLNSLLVLFRFTGIG